MRALKLEAVSGSQKSITTKEKWIYGHSSWTDDEVSGQPATSFATAASEESDSDDGADDESASGDGDDDSEESGGSDELY